MNNLGVGMRSIKVVREFEDYRAHGSEDINMTRAKGCLFCKPTVTAKCGVASPITRLITCTRPPGHDSRHAACTTYKHPYEVW